MKHRTFQGTKYLVLTPGKVQFYAGSNMIFDEPACIAYDSMVCKPVAIGAHAEDVAKDARPASISVFWPLRHENGPACTDIVADLVNAFARRIVSTVGNVASDLVVTFPKEVMSDEVLRAVHPVVKKAFSCRIRFAEIKDPETGLASGVVFHEVPGAGTGSAAKVIITAAVTSLAAACGMICGFTAADVVFLSLLALAASRFISLKADEVRAIRKHMVIRPSDVEVSRSLIVLASGSLMLLALMWLTGHMLVCKVCMMLAAFCTVGMQSEGLQAVRQQVRREHIIRLQRQQDLGSSKA